MESDIFIARDANGDLYLFEKKPHRTQRAEGNVWRTDESDYMRVDSSMFPQLTWEDEPMEITLKQKDNTLALSDNSAQQINHVWAMYATLQQEVTKLREENAYWRAKIEDLKKLVLN